MTILLNFCRIGKFSSHIIYYYLLLSKMCNQEVSGIIYFGFLLKYTFLVLFLSPVKVIGAYLGTSIRYSLVKFNNSSGRCTCAYQAFRRSRHFDDQAFNQCCRNLRSCLDVCSTAGYMKAALLRARLIAPFTSDAIHERQIAKRWQCLCILPLHPNPRVCHRRCVGVARTACGITPCPACPGRPWRASTERSKKRETMEATAGSSQ